MTKRAELFIIISGALLFFVCFFVHPIFPVQRYPLFADTPTKYETYRIMTPSGLELLPQNIRLQNTYDGDPTYQVGRHPLTAYKWGQVLSFEDLRTHFKSIATDLISEFPILCITRTIWGTQPDKAFGALSFESFVWIYNDLTADYKAIQSHCGPGVE